jgi:hypothetical protein
MAEEQDEQLTELRRLVRANESHLVEVRRQLTNLENLIFALKFWLAQFVPWLDPAEAAVEIEWAGCRHWRKNRPPEASSPNTLRRSV